MGWMPNRTVRHLFFGTAHIDHFHPAIFRPALLARIAGEGGGQVVHWRSLTVGIQKNV